MACLRAEGMAASNESRVRVRGLLEDHQERAAREAVIERALAPRGA